MSELSSKAKKLFDEFSYSQTVYHAFLASGINNEYIEKKRKMRDAKRESFEEYVVGLESRIEELEHDLTNKEIEYTDLWDDALAFQARIAELEAAQRWHVVADGELPIVGKSIMFYDSSSGEIYRGVYTASHHWRANYFSEKCGTVTRWMPLPEPPEVQE